MRLDQLKLLETIAIVNARGVPAEADTAELQARSFELFDAGYLFICPPGHRWRLNAEGRAVVAEFMRKRAARELLHSRVRFRRVAA